MSSVYPILKRWRKREKILLSSFSLQQKQKEFCFLYELETGFQRVINTHYY